MKVVLDECLPKRLCHDFAEQEAVTAPMMGLAGIENGGLMRQLDGRCDAFVTIDANLAHQQNFGRLSFAVIVVKAATNKFEDVHPLAGQILPIRTNRKNPAIFAQVVRLHKVGSGANRSLQSGV